MDMRRLSSALQLVSEAIDIRRTLYGEQHPQVAKSLYLKAEILFKNNQLQLCQETAERALEIN